VTAELAAAAAAAGSSLKGPACASARACLSAGESLVPMSAEVSFVEREPAITPGMLLTKMPGEGGGPQVRGVEGGC
jgi:hypothetical protein